ncbi:MAG: hypothetical protein JSS66_05300 [Armatimonadetes bacterium]|nr:hypothetical protein [Armatimonadota bacterium]
MTAMTDNAELEETTVNPTNFKELVEMDAGTFITQAMSQDFHASFSEEYAMWQEYLSRLDQYDDGEVRKQLHELNLDGLLPNVKTSDVYEAYYRLVQTHKFLYSLHTPVYKRVEMLKDAIKSLKSAARGMFKGTDKDRDAHCDRMVRHLAAELSQAKTTMAAVAHAIDVVDFAAMQASRVIKEREFEMRVNGTYVGQGMSDSFNRLNRIENDDDEDNPLPPQYRSRR